MNPALELELSVRGASSAVTLAAALKVSQPTLSRRIAQAGSRIVRIGRGRATLYALRREIPPVGSAWPLYRIDEQGRPHLNATLRSLHSRQWALEQAEPWDTLLGGGEFPNGLFPDLPWFLYDLRPQGFLGRSFARTYGGLLQIPTDPQEWGADAVLRALVGYGSDLPGAWVLGEAMLREVQSQRLHPPETIRPDAREEAYSRLADAALAGELPGSSAGGEQPKFTARIGTTQEDQRHVIVKFSGNGGRPEDQRWADLLTSEHLAAKVLAKHGIPAAETQLLRSGGRVFLESTRFDRVGAFGRRMLVSLMALDAVLFGEPFTPWTHAAQRLGSEGWLPREDAEHLDLLWWFGSLIGNTDMHYGNALVFLRPDRPLRLAPSYDMLPMFYRPGTHGDFPTNPLPPQFAPPEKMAVRMRASVMAREFWQTLAEKKEVSPDFRKVAKQNFALLVEE